MPRRSYFAPTLRGRGLGDTAPTVQQLLVQAAQRYGFDPSLILAQAQQESGFRNVTNPNTGACGVLQLLPSTAAQYGVTNCLNVAANIDAGVHYLADLLNQFGDIAKALAAYDWGPGNLAKAIAAWGDQWLAHAPAETQNYVATIAGVAPPPVSQGAPPPPLTIDAATGLPIDDSTPTPPAAAASLPSLDLSSVPTPVLIGAAAALAALVLRDLLND